MTRFAGNRSSGLDGFLLAFEGIFERNVQIVAQIGAARGGAGIGLRAPAISWGGDIFAAQSRLRQAWWPLIWPSTFLAVTVLAFIMLGDAIRDAFDPRSR